MHNLAVKLSINRRRFETWPVNLCRCGIPASGVGPVYLRITALGRYAIWPLEIKRGGKVDEATARGRLLRRLLRDLINAILFRKGNFVALLIGTDEAGYGPPLGPLVISATAWDGRAAAGDLFRLLADVVADTPKSARSGPSRRLLIADSKVACRSGSIGGLETTVLLLLESVYGRRPKTLADLVTLVMPGGGEDFLAKHFWLAGPSVKLPLEADDVAGRDGCEMGARFRAACDRNGIRLTEIRSTILLPPEFNAAVVDHGNKATLLSYRTLRLVGDLIKGAADDTLIECDKHGGRSYYRELIFATLTDHPVEIVKETRQQSVYRWNQRNQNCEIRFTARGEGQMAVALASMVSKYVREVFMVAWNDYWRSHVPNIKPTKGYPQDARRFLGEIEDVVLQHQLSRNDFVRSC